MPSRAKIAPAAHILLVPASERLWFIVRLSVIKSGFRDAVATLGLFAVTLGLVIFPSEMVAAAQSGVDMAWRVIVPSLFPFFVVSNMAVRMGLADRLGAALAPVMRPVFNVSGPCAAALVLGFIGGYPVGAKTVIALYENGSCTKREAERMLAFSNNSGPAFILGVVGAGIFSSGRVGLLLYLAHFAASLMIGLLFRFWGGREEGSDAPPERAAREGYASAFIASVSSGFTSCLGICGFVVFFTVLIRLLFLSGLMNHAAALLARLLASAGITEWRAERLLTGVIELTSGVWSLRDASRELPASMAMAAFMLGWAGISVHCQVLSFLSGTGISPKTYFIGKLLHGVLSAGLILLVGRVVPLSAPVALILAGEVKSLAAIGFWSALRVSAVSAAAIAAVFALAGLADAPRRR